MSTYPRKTLTRPERITAMILEDACSIYCAEHNLSSEPLEPAVEMLRNTRPRTLDEIIASATKLASEINSPKIENSPLSRIDETLEHE